MNDLTILFTENRLIEKFKEPIRVLGIDLGTTNSTVAEIVYAPGDKKPLTVRCLEVEQDTLEGKYTNTLVSSVVAIYNGKIYVGEGAKRLRSQSPALGLVQNRNIFYECKNDIGILRTYHQAQEGFRSASEISGKILDFLCKAARSESEIEAAHTVVTVPASFQGAQRNDTLTAAKLAGLKLSGGDLLDEPIAAFLDYLILNHVSFLSDIYKPRNILIFDFGGGTCDVAIFSLAVSHEGSPLKIAPLSISRYHRLGGGDIDKAIVYEILIPQLLEQNSMDKFDLTFEDKKLFIEAELLGLAEALKIGICTEISLLDSFGKYGEADKGGISKKHPGTYICTLKDKALSLKSPQITAKQFEKVLKPFLEKDFLYARETEYRMTCSIFAPLLDVLDRANLNPEDIHYCLLVGGSSLIPQVVKEISEYFHHANILKYRDKESLQVAIARGAAYHSLALKVFGKGFIQPVCHDDIYIRTEHGLINLISKDTALPYPMESFKRCELAIPETVLAGYLDLRLELVAGKNEALLYNTNWKIAGPINKGDVIHLEYRYDENQIFDFRIKLSDRDDYFVATIENPLTNIVNPQSKRKMILQLEEDMRAGKVEKEQMPGKLAELASDYAELGHIEKAIDFLKRALKAKNSPDEGILNKIGIYYGELMDFEKQEKFYKEAASVSRWGGSLFNLALSQQKRGNYEEAIKNINEALERERLAPYFVLRAILAEAVNKPKERKEFLDEAFKGFGTLSSLSDWELGWYISAAEMEGDKKRINQAKDEQKKRLSAKEGHATNEGKLPHAKGDLV